MSTGENSYHAPFQHQGTGTINTMVLALLSMIAEAKKNVIFAMEEPEIAIPPYTQKRIIDSIRKKSTQALFTSHSPFVLEEFAPEQIILIQRNKDGVVKSQNVAFPSIIKPKTYNAEFRLRFSEALLAKRILLTEGATEAIAYFGAGRRLNELKPKKYKSLESMGVALFDVQSQTSLELYGDYFKSLGKTVFAVFDKQDAIALARIQNSVDFPFESPHKGFEDLIIEETDSGILIEFYQQLISEDEWPTHLDKLKVQTLDDIEGIKKAIWKYLKWSKGSRSSSELLGLCKIAKHLPITIRKALLAIREELEPKLEPIDD
jgi:putative ATP-dependent endonuclease of OLD family